MVDREGSSQGVPEAPSRPEHPQFQLSRVAGSGVGCRTAKSRRVCPLSLQVRMAILRIISQLALSGFQDRIKGWGLKYVSVQLTLSTYKLVSGPAGQTMEQLDFGKAPGGAEERILLRVPGASPHVCPFTTRVPGHTQQAAGV